MEPQKLSLKNIQHTHEELIKIFEKKNKDYGNSFEESLEKHGIIAAIVRMEDKMLRLSNLSKNQSEQLVKDESIIDTLKDLSNYALMTAVWLEQTQLLQKVDHKIAEYKGVPFVKDNEGFDMSYFDGNGWKFKDIIQDIINFDPGLIATNSITFDNIDHPDAILFDVYNTERIVSWWLKSEYSKKLNYDFTYYNTIADSKTGRIRIVIKGIKRDA